MERFSHLRQAFPDQKLPTFFNKQVSSITGPYDPILAPYDSQMLDFEGELVAVIGQRLRRADPATAHGSVAGYTVGNDVSVRDWQQDTPTMWPGKSFDTHGPIGPWIVTADELNPADVKIRTWVDGELRQEGSTAEMITGVADMISALSKVCTLEPGDLVATGTPGGVGLFSGRMLRPGQRVRVEIEGIGAIENPVDAETPAGRMMPTTISCSIPPLEPFSAAVGHARLAEELGYDAIMFSHIASRDSFTLAGRVGTAHRADRTGHGGGAAVSPVSGLDGPDRGHGRRCLRRAVSARPRGGSPGDDGRLAWPADRQPDRRDA